MRFREGSMRSFRELSRGSKIHSRHPKKEAAPPPKKAPQGAVDELGASGLKKNPTLHLQSERHTNRDSLEAGRAIKAEDTKKATQ